MTRAVLLLFVILATPRSDPVPSFPVTDQSRLGAPHASTPQRSVGHTLGVVPEPTETAGSGAAALHLSGPASWYRYRPGEGAAGPRLRAWLGAAWRGQRVVVTANGRSVVVTLTDFMVADRLVDLDRASFAVLANPAVGLVLVTITQSGPLATAPPTDTEGGTP